MKIWVCCFEFSALLSMDEFFRDSGSSRQPRPNAGRKTKKIAVLVHSPIFCIYIDILVWLQESCILNLVGFGCVGAQKK